MEGGGPVCCLAVRGMPTVCSLVLAERQWPEQTVQAVLEKQQCNDGPQGGKECIRSLQETSQVSAGSV